MYDVPIIMSHPSIFMVQCRYLKCKMTQSKPIQMTQLTTHGIKIKFFDTYIDRSDG